jgi:hypothetical protein
VYELGNVIWLNANSLVIIPLFLGDLEGGSKERKDFPDIVRITAELLGGLSALKRTPDLRVLMFHGPLVYMMSAYAGHTPFTKKTLTFF